MGHHACRLWPRAFELLCHTPPVGLRGTQLKGLEHCLHSGMKPLADLRILVLLPPLKAILQRSTGSPLVLPGPIFCLLDLLLDTGVHPSSSSSLNFTPATPLLVNSTINLSLTSEETLTDSKLPATGYLRTKGQESVYETCACVITLFYSATRALILSGISH